MLNLISVQNIYLLLIIHYICVSGTNNKLLSYKPENHTNKPIDTEITLDQVKQALPPEVFQKSICKSMFYFFRDIFFIVTTYNYFQTCQLPNIIKIPLHAFIQGTLGLAMWCIAHDCGPAVFQIINH